MNKKLTVLVATVGVVGLGILGTSATLAKEDLSAKLAKLESDFSTKQKKFLEMPNQTQDEANSVVAEGEKIKQLDLEKEKVRRETDTEDEAHFENQLDSYILGLKDSVVELKERAEREQNADYLKQAEKVQQKIDKFEQGKVAYLNKQKTVGQLRKELDLPAN